MQYTIEVTKYFVFDSKNEPSILELEALVEKLEISGNWTETSFLWFEDEDGNQINSY